MPVGQSVEGLERYPINLRYPRELRDSIERLRELAVITPRGDHIPLSAVAIILGTLPLSLVGGIWRLRWFDSCLLRRFGRRFRRRFHGNGIACTAPASG